MYCQNCGTKNPDEANFCFKCGRELSITVIAEQKIIELNGKDKTDCTLVRIAELSGDIMPELKKQVYDGNILMIDVSPARYDKLVFDRAIEDLKQVVNDVHGDIAMIKEDHIVVTPRGIRIDREKICNEMKKHKDPMTAFTLSAIPGFGHFYLNNYKNGLFYFLFPFFMGVIFYYTRIININVVTIFFGYFMAIIFAGENAYWEAKREIPKGVLAMVFNMIELNPESEKKVKTYLKIIIAIILFVYFSYSIAWILVDY